MHSNVATFTYPFPQGMGNKRTDARAYSRPLPSRTTEPFCYFLQLTPSHAIARPQPTRALWAAVKKTLLTPHKVLAVHDAVKWGRPFLDTFLCLTGQTPFFLFIYFFSYSIFSMFFLYIVICYY